MTRENELVTLDTTNVREMLSGSGYSERAIAYYLDKPNMGYLSDADQVSELTGECGDTMKVYFGKGVNAIAPGQAAVFYEGEDIIGGGWILSSFRQKDEGN